MNLHSVDSWPIAWKQTHIINTTGGLNVQLCEQENLDLFSLTWPAAAGFQQIFSLSPHHCTVNAERKITHKNTAMFNYVTFQL